MLVPSSSSAPGSFVAVVLRAFADAVHIAFAAASSLLANADFATAKQPLAVTSECTSDSEAEDAAQKFIHSEALILKYYRPASRKQKAAATAVVDISQKKEGKTLRHSKEQPVLVPPPSSSSSRPSFAPPFAPCFVPSFTPPPGLGCAAPPHEAASTWWAPREAEDRVAAAWRLVWCCERCHKPDAAARRERLSQAAAETGGSLLCLKKADKFAHWLTKLKGRKPSVLLTDWREAKPCLQALSQQPEDWQPLCTLILVDEPKLLFRVSTWLSDQQASFGDVRAFSDESALIDCIKEAVTYHVPEA